MKIAIIKSGYTPFGGLEKYATRLINAFAKRECRVDVLTSGSRPWEKLEGPIKITALKQLNFTSFAKLVTFNASVVRRLEQETYDCVLGMDRTVRQTHLRAGNGCHRSWLKRRSMESCLLKKMSFTLNPFHLKMLEFEQRAFLDDKLVRIFCNSNLVKNDIFEFYPGASDKLMVIHNGVEWNEFTTPFEQGMEKKGKILLNLNLTDDKFYFLFVGSGYERKGLGKAIQAIASLPRETELIVVGKDKGEKKYKALAKRLGLLSRVHFQGPRRNIVPYLQVADAFVLPTIYDPFSNASLEALAMGLYTVTSGANGCSEVIEEGAGQVIRDLANLDSVAEAMRNALGPHLAKKEIRESVKNLNFEKQLEKIVDVCLKDSGKGE